MQIAATQAGRVDAVREVDMEAGGQGAQVQKIYTIRQVDRRRTMVHHKTAHHLDMQPGSHGHARNQPLYCSGVGESLAAAEGAGFRPTSAKVEQGHATPHSANRKSADMGSPLMDTICRCGGPVEGLGSEFDDGYLPGRTCLAQENIVHDDGALSVAENGYMGRRAEGWAVLEDVWVGTEWAAGIWEDEHTTDAHAPRANDRPGDLTSVAMRLPGSSAFTTSSEPYLLVGSTKVAAGGEQDEPGLR
ncbi:hypothetical protein CCHR01_12083 [Colletotrichum chrysophilum]|uniref:Uncharacterized protein n=1 Tax=Colletotrichum chrysophilum TaxID=1836956 RepID=A0AAD9EBQ7_9PEZI|nr:hypothetical protein CCHR01_12083 [Colletotrichum chrysophilum]